MKNNTAINFGLIGCGWITENVHIPGLLLSPDARLITACDSVEAVLKRVSEKFSIPNFTTHYEDILADDRIDAVIIATPNNLHKPIAMEAIKAGKHILCEKPLGLDLEECSALVDAVKDTDLINVVSFLYRFVPAMRYLKYLVEADAFGEIRHFRANYLQHVPEIYLGWRSDPKQNGESGALGDVGVHLIDFARYLVGDFHSVTGWVKTFLTERYNPQTDTQIPCTVDDAAGYFAEFSNGATGVFEVTRLAIGRGCGRMDYQSLEVNGTKGSAVYLLQDPFRLQIATGKPFDDQQMLTMDIPDEFLKLPGVKLVRTRLPSGAFQRKVQGPE